MRFFLAFVFVAFFLKSTCACNLDIPENKLAEFAKNLEESLKNNNPTFLNNSIDFQELFNEVIKFSGELYAFNEGFKQSVKFNVGLGSLIMDEVEGKGDIELVTYKTDSNTAWFLLRTFSTEGINYYKLFGKIKDGSVIIRDAYIYKTAQLYSTHLSSLYASILFGKEADFELPYRSDKMAEKVRSLENISDLIIQKKYSKVLKKWGKYPEGIRYDREILLSAIEASSFVDVLYTKKLVSEYTERFGREGSIYLLLLDGFYVQRKYNETLSVIDSIAIGVFNDPLLNLYRGMIYSDMGDSRKAEHFFKMLIAEEPDVKTGYFSLIFLYLKDEKYTSAIHILDQLRNNYGYYKADFSKMFQQYPKFLNSKEYIDWVGN